MQLLEILRFVILNLDFRAGFFVLHYGRTCHYKPASRISRFKLLIRMSASCRFVFEFLRRMFCAGLYVRQKR